MRNGNRNPLILNFGARWWWSSTGTNSFIPPSTETPVNTKWQTYLFNPLNAELNPIRHLLALTGAHHFVHVSRIRVTILPYLIRFVLFNSCPSLCTSYVAELWVSSYELCALETVVAAPSSADALHAVLYFICREHLPRLPSGAGVVVAGR